MERLTVFPFLMKKIIASLLLRRDCCTFSNGEYVKAGLAELELWCAQAKEEVIYLCLLFYVSFEVSPYIT